MSTPHVEAASVAPLMTMRTMKAVPAVPAPLSFSFPTSALNSLPHPSSSSIASSASLPPPQSTSPAVVASTSAFSPPPALAPSPHTLLPSPPAPPPAAPSSSPPDPSPSPSSEPIRLPKSSLPPVRALLIPASGAVFPLTVDEATVGAKTGRCQVVISGCSEVSAVHLVISYDRLQQRWQLQVAGRTGASVQGQHFFPSSLQHPLPTSTAVVIPCTSSHHCHVVQFCLPHQPKRGAPTAPFSLSAVKLQAEELHNNRVDWSDAEQLRFQRAFMSFGVHGVDKVKRMGYMTKKSVAQLTNYAAAFLLECRKQLDDDTELLYVDTVLEKEGWALTHPEPSLAKWKKLQSNASVWIKRLRTIQLLEDLIVTAQAQDVDVLSLLPKQALRVHLATAPAPWWDNSHDRLLLHAVYEHGYCRYDDVKADRKYKFLIPRHWQHRVKELNDESTQKGPSSRSKKGKAGDDDDAADDVDDEEDDGGDDAAPTEEKKDADDTKTASTTSPTALPGTEAEDKIDVNDNTYGIQFPSADVLTKRMRRLVENQRKTWWKREGAEEREVPIRIRQKRRSDQHAAEGTERKKLRLSPDGGGRTWSTAAVRALVDAVMSLGLEKDAYQRIVWSRVMEQCRGDGLQLADEDEPALERLFLHCLEDHYMQMHSPALASIAVFGLPIVQPPSLISSSDGAALSSRLLLFSKLRSRVLVQSLYTLRSLLDTHRPPPPSAPLPSWYWPASHDLPLLLGASKYGVAPRSWQRMVDDKELGWASSPSPAVKGEERKAEDREAEDAADQEIRAIIQHVDHGDGQPLAKQPPAVPTPQQVSVLHYEGLMQRVQDLVDALYPISQVQAPLSTTFSALCPLVPAESSKARRKRESTVQEDPTGGRRSRRGKRVMKEVSIYQLVGGELTHSTLTFVPSLTRYTHYLFAHPAPLEATVSPFEVSPLSVTAVSTSHPVWKPLVRHLKTNTIAGHTSNSVYICGDRRDEHHHLSPLHSVYRVTVTPSGQLVLPHWLTGGLTVYALGAVDARCQFVDERDGERGVHLAPVGYRAVRVHQSFIDPNRMARYLCEVVEAPREVKGEEGGALQSSLFSSSSVQFRLTSSDCPDVPLVSHSPHALWGMVSNLIFDMTDAPLASRRNGGSNGWERFGLSHPLVRWMIEHSNSLDVCPAYKKQGPITVQRYEEDRAMKTE